jgi:hypothetical protein
VPAGCAIKDLYDRHAAGLRYLYARMGRAKAHPVAAFWLVFWDDLWSNNRVIAAVAANEAILDPKNPRAIANGPVPRAKLEELLGACEPAVLDDKKLVTPALLDLLYAECDRRAAGGGAIGKVVPIGELAGAMEDQFAPLNSVQPAGA